MLPPQRAACVFKTFERARTVWVIEVAGTLSPEVRQFILQPVAFNLLINLQVTNQTPDSPCPELCRRAGAGLS
jgi:hypothetical protein